MPPKYLPFPPWQLHRQPQTYISSTSVSKHPSSKYKSANILSLGGDTIYEHSYFFLTGRWSCIEVCKALEGTSIAATSCVGPKYLVFYQDPSGILRESVFGKKITWEAGLFTHLYTLDWGPDTDYPNRRSSCDRCASLYSTRYDIVAQIDITYTTILHSQVWTPA